MHVPATRQHRRSRSRARRVMLVGLPSLTANILERHLREVAEVVCVAFPGDAFDRAAGEFGPELVVVDLTYLDETVVRPLFTTRFAGSGALVAYLSERRGSYLHDLASGTTEPLVDASVAGIVRLASGSPLTLVAKR